MFEPVTSEFDISFFYTVPEKHFLLIENTNILPAYVLGDSRPYRINEDAIKAIKDELLTGRGVSVGYYADQSRIELRHLITELKCFEYIYK